MAIAYMDVRTHFRARGHSVAAAVAYRLGERLVDCRTKCVHDYTRRRRGEDILHCGIRIDSAQQSAITPQFFSDALESAEPRSNSRIARDIQVAFPHELDQPQTSALAESLATHLATEFHTGVAYAVHSADKRGDVRNVHAHFLMATRTMSSDATMGAKLRKLDNPLISRGLIQNLRSEWETLCNTALEKAGHAVRIDMGKTTDDPAPHVGPAPTSMERKAARKRRPSAGREALTETVADEAVTELGGQLRANTERRRGRRQLREEMNELATEVEADIAELKQRTVEPDPVIEADPLAESPSSFSSPIRGNPFLPDVSSEPVAETDSLTLPGAPLALPQDEPQPVMDPDCSLKERQRTLDELKAARARKARRAEEDRAAALQREQDLRDAEAWLTRAVPANEFGKNLADAADVRATLFLAGSGSSLPATYFLRPALKDHCRRDKFGEIPDYANVGACRSRAGAEAAGRVLDQALLDIARKHFGDEDPSTYRPGFFEASLKKVQAGALKAWAVIKATVVSKMISAAVPAEAAAIARRRNLVANYEESARRERQLRQQQVQSPSNPPSPSRPTRSRGFSR